MAELLGRGPRPAEAPSFINIRLADELAASGRTSEHAQSSACGFRLRLRLVTSRGSPFKLVCVSTLSDFTRDGALGV